MRPIHCKLGILFAIVIVIIFRSELQSAEQSKAKQIEKLIYDRLKKDGGINHPKFPFIIKANRIRGKALQFVRILHRTKSGKGYESIGKCLEMKLQVDESAKKIHV